MLTSANGKLSCQKTLITVFCSMGNFASNVDDLLTDSRRDEVDIQVALNDPEGEDCEALYRFHSRIFSVAETIIEDFEMVLQKKNLPKQAKKLKAFINAVINIVFTLTTLTHKWIEHITTLILSRLV